MRFGEVDHRLQGATNLIGAVHVALDHVHNRVEQQQRSAADLLHGITQQVEVCGRVEWLTLTGRVHTPFDDVDAGQIGTRCHQPRHQGVSRVILGRPDQGVSGL